MPRVKRSVAAKKKHVVRFLEAGAKVKVTIMFRGREMVHAERGLAILERLAKDVTELGHVEAEPKLEGRNMFMVVAPNKTETAKEKAEGREAEKAAAKEAARAEEQEAVAE